MTDYKKIKISNYTYNLPDERIARYPLPERDRSKLLVWDQGQISTDQFINIGCHLPEGSMLVFNNTRVIHARLFFTKSTGARIEIFCLEPSQPSYYQIAFQETRSTVWKCLVGNAKRWKEELLTREIQVQGIPVRLQARKINKEDASFLIEFSWSGGVSFSDLIEAAGVLPIPPYLNRDSEAADEETYQTVYAKKDGSVAAPTAGLHFTDRVFADLKKKDIALREVTLHVGAGTFRPVKSETIDGHIMHHEAVAIPKTFIEELAGCKRKIIAVGTTSVRSLESLYWLGARPDSLKTGSTGLTVDQWAPYASDPEITYKEALQNILVFLDQNKLDMLHFSTQIIIVPGYRFRIVEGIVTNFHQPQSTLLLLIGAFLGKEWQEVYEYALSNDFRFLSYGDSNLYLK